MKQYKQFKEYNGVQLKNIQFFPSMEWGPEGGFSFDIFYKYKKVGYLYNAGDGGDHELHLPELKTPEEKQKFFDVVKKSIPDSFYRLTEKQYRQEKLPEFYLHELEKDFNRKEGKESDLIFFMEFCEYDYLRSQQRGR